MKVFAACPKCGQITAVRRNGKVKFHRVKVWDDKTQTGRLARCDGVNELIKCNAAYATYEAAASSITSNRQKTIKELIRDIEPETQARDHEKEDRAVEAVGAGLLLPGRDF
jgi:hypothetical protein